MAAAVLCVYNALVRAFAPLVLLAACHAGPSSTHLPVAPLAIDHLAPHWTQGEQTTWNVFWSGVLIGRARLELAAGEARSSFRTGALASVIEPVRHELVSWHAAGRVTAIADSLTIAGRTEQRVTRADGTAPLHSLHSALAVVRAWSRGERRPGYLWLVHQGERFRLDVFAPSRDRALGVAALRVEGVARTGDGASAIGFTLWLAANAERTPLRIAIDGGVSAEAAESTAAFD
jgi:hypothetical protein